MASRKPWEEKPGIFALQVSNVKTGSWRQECPVIIWERCTGCGICAKYCPIHIISITDIASIDYDYCKGCGICSTVCPKQAIEIIEGANTNA